MSWECISYWIESHPGLASWVQAFGSIGAIFVAIWVSGGDRRHRAKVEKAARRDAIDRAISASEHARKITKNNHDFFSCTRPPSGEVPRYLAVIDHAAARIRDVSASPGVDSEVLGHVSEVSSALVDVKGLVEQTMKSADGTALVDLGYLKGNVDRIDRAIDNLKAIRTS
ncbi:MULTISPECIES: hypothetical protein [Pseudomonas]|uniref:hypothetical protein n=1 Tax=Pseudomonas sp. FW305-E2 TaxID=2075558 RepID=UPI0011799DAD|nr:MULTISPECIES: hypothetical protein [Pseudomonas]